MMSWLYNEQGGVTRKEKEHANMTALHTPPRPNQTQNKYRAKESSLHSSPNTSRGGKNPTKTDKRLQMSSRCVDNFYFLNRSLAENHSNCYDLFIKDVTLISI